MPLFSFDSGVKCLIKNQSYSITISTIGVSEISFSRVWRDISVGNEWCEYWHRTRRTSTGLLCGPYESGIGSSDVEVNHGHNWLVESLSSPIFVPCDLTLSVDGVNLFVRSCTEDSQAIEFNFETKGKSNLYTFVFTYFEMPVALVPSHRIGENKDIVLY